MLFHFPWLEAYSSSQASLEYTTGASCEKSRRRSHAGLRISELRVATRVFPSDMPEPVWQAILGLDRPLRPQAWLTRITSLSTTRRDMLLPRTTVGRCTRSRHSSGSPWSGERRASPFLATHTKRVSPATGGDQQRCLRAYSERGFLPYHPNSPGFRRYGPTRALYAGRKLRHG